MNPTWQDFLSSQPISTTPSSNALYSIPHLSILTVSGDDAAQFLQGQLTCNIKELTEKNSFFAGFCNPKGRVISTFLILKQNDVFLLILPSVLLDEVKNKLQKYVLRSKVQLQDGSEEFCVSGLSCTKDMATGLSLPEINFFRHNDYLKLPNQHYLMVAEVAETIKWWSDLMLQGFQTQNPSSWELLDLNAGLAWLDAANTEQYIPQMLNLDKLGGISLTKGCYTGQEVVARTHYLGKAKRELFLAELAADAIFTDTNSVMDESGENMGQILTVFHDDASYKMLLVLQASAVAVTELRLNNSKQDKITLIPFATA